jgi:hypothetical protein
MGITHGFNRLAARERFVQVHGAAARHQENVLDTLVRNKLDKIIRKFWHELFNL